MNSEVYSFLGSVFFSLKRTHFRTRCLTNRGPVGAVVNIPGSDPEGRGFERGGDLRIFGARGAENFENLLSPRKL